MTSSRSHMHNYPTVELACSTYYQFIITAHHHVAAIGLQFCILQSFHLAANFLFEFCAKLTYKLLLCCITMLHHDVVITNTLPRPSASEVTTVWRYTNMFIIITMSPVIGRCIAQSACLYVLSHISKITCPNFPYMFPVVMTRSSCDDYAI